MKFNCNRKTWAEEKADLLKWHRIFFWWPTRINTRDCRWLEYGERRYKYIGPYSGNPRKPEYR